VLKETWCKICKLLAAAPHLL